MASVIKSLEIDEAAFSLGAIEATADAPRLGAAVGKSADILSPALADGSSSGVKAQSASEQAAKQLEDTVRSRVDETIRRKVQELEEKQRADEDELFTAASERGYEDGLRRATESVTSQQEALEKRLELLEENITKAVSEAFSNATELACEIAFEAVLKILGREIATGDAVAALTREVAIRTDATGEVVLRVNPVDAELLNKRSEGAIPSRYRLEVDESLTRGGCVIETSHGIVDARLETRLDAFMVALRGSPSEHPEALP